MSGEIASDCCCGGGPTPSPNCPDDGTPPPPPTVSIKLEASPVACSWVKSATCVPMTCGCDGGAGQTQIKPCGPITPCATLVPAYMPYVNFVTGLGPAKAFACWPTYSDETYPSQGTCASTIVPCGTWEQGYDPYSANWSFTLSCGGDGSLGVCNATASGNAQYYPSQAAYEGGNGVKVEVSGYCCETCRCVGNPKCSVIAVSVHAIWTISAQVPWVRFIPHVPGGCQCNDPYFDLGAWILQSAPYGPQTLDFVHQQYLTMEFENTIYTTQTEKRLAPGGYAPRCIQLMQNQCGAAAVTGFYSFTGSVDACNGSGTYFPGFITAGNDCDVPCLVQGQQCSAADLAAHGWGIRVSVA